MKASKVLPRLREQVAKAQALITSPRISEEDYRSWTLETEHWLERVYGEGHHRVRAVLHAGPQRIRDMDESEAQRHRHLASALTAKMAQLSTAVGLLELEAQDEEDDAGIAVSASLPSSASTTASRASSSKKVFIVHGHDEAAKLAVARFISKLKLEDVILHEQTNRGRTIIEKFEAHAGDVAYAVVLLTPDDRGGPATATFEQQQPRARQNVVFELGFFIGALGRERVCALHKPGTELPSDISGVVYIEMDPGNGWKLQLAREIRDVIPSVDMNDAV